MWSEIAKQLSSIVDGSVVVTIQGKPCIVRAGTGPFGYLTCPPILSAAMTIPSNISAPVFLNTDCTAILNSEKTPFLLAERWAFDPSTTPVTTTLLSFTGKAGKLKKASDVVILSASPG